MPQFVSSVQEYFQLGSLHLSNVAVPKGTATSDISFLAGSERLPY
jgi:hypothetical protein